ncbi:hypothetical protein K2X85_15470 [bacterium]|nr:hypothetical protein [bacterium]
MGITFREKDWATFCASQYNYYNMVYSIKISKNNPDWDEAIRQLENIPDNSLSGVYLAGHGSSDLIGPISTDSLTKSASEKKFFEVLGRKIKKGGEIELRACKCATGVEGTAFLRLLADISDRTVVGFTGKYNIYPFGDEIVARPGEDPFVRRNHGDYRESCLSWTTGENDKKNEKKR